MLINEFCESKGIPVHIEEMFEEYLREAYDFLFGAKARELSHECLGRLWLEFVYALEAALTTVPLETDEKETYESNRTIFDWNVHAGVW